jgi:hypothetical protein
MNNLDTIISIICIVISLILLIGAAFIMRRREGYITYEEVSPMTDEEIMNSSVYKWREAILHDLETRIIYAFGLANCTNEEIKKVMHMSMVYDDEHDASRCTYVYENFILTLYIRWSGWFRSIRAQMELLDDDNFVPGETVVLASTNQVIMRSHHGIYNYTPLINLINYMFNMESGLLNITEKDMAELDAEIAQQAKVLREAISTSINKLKASSDAAAAGDLSADTIAAISYKSQLANSIRRLILLMRNPAARKVPGLVKSYIALMSNLAIYFGPDEWANLTAGLVEVQLPPMAAPEDTTSA